MKEEYLALQLQGQKVDIILDDNKEINNAKIVSVNDFFEIEQENGRTIYVNKNKIKIIKPLP